MMLLVMMRLYHDTVGGGSVGVSRWFSGRRDDVEKREADTDIDNAMIM